MRLVIAITAIFFIQCASAQKLRQGIKGQVFWISGNQMPGPNKVSAPQQGVVREVHIYKVATLADAVQEDGFFKEIKTPLVATITTGTDGTFKVKLPPGEYSIFTLESKGLFANLYDRNNRINPVIVKTKKYSWISIAVDYEATY